LQELSKDKDQTIEIINNITPVLDSNKNQTNEEIDPKPIKMN
jgi:hypothetical protein